MKTTLKIFMLMLLLTSAWAQYPAEWVVDAHDFEYTMTLTGELRINGTPTADIGTIVAAFSDGQCRGVVSGTQVGTEIRYFLLIYANIPGDSLQFQAWDAAVGNVVPLDQAISFSSGSALGDVDAPYPLTGINSISFIQAFDDAYEQAEDTDFSIPFDLLANDVYDRSLAMVVTFPTQPLHGFLLENVDQTFSFVSDENFFGQDSFQYRVSHEYGADSAWVQANITPVDDPLGAFHLQNPVDSSFFEAGAVSNQVFTWEIPEEVDGDPVNYSLYIYDGETLDTTYSTNNHMFTVHLEELNRDTWLGWHVIATDGWGWTVSVDTFSFRVSSLVDVNQIQALPETFYMEQNYPNPFNPETQISYSLSESMLISLSLYDLKGRQVHAINLGEKTAGSHVFRLNMNGLNADSGIYYYQLSARSTADPASLSHRVGRMLYLQ